MQIRTLKDLEALVDPDGHDDDDNTGGLTTMTLKFTAKAEEKGKDAAQIVSDRARALCFTRNQDPKNFTHLSEATIEVLKADPALGEAYKQLQEACA